MKLANLIWLLKSVAEGTDTKYALKKASGKSSVFRWVNEAIKEDLLTQEEERGKKEVIRKKLSLTKKGYIILYAREMSDVRDVMRQILDLMLEDAKFKKVFNKRLDAVLESVMEEKKLFDS